MCTTSTTANSPITLYSPLAHRTISPTTHYSPTPISLHKVLDLPSPMYYGTNSTSGRGILDKIDDIVQEEEDILFWELQELLFQELEDIADINFEIGREELHGDDATTHVTSQYETNVDKVFNEYNLCCCIFKNILIDNAILHQDWDQEYRMIEEEEMAQQTKVYHIMQNEDDIIFRTQDEL